MTNTEAIEILKSRRMCAAYVDSEYVDSIDIEAVDIAIAALEEQEKPLTVLPCEGNVTPIKCTGLNCPMQAGKVDPATCKAADTCIWATKPLTHADRIRTMTDEELACFIARQRFSVVNQIADKFGIDVTMAFIVCRKNVLKLLKTEEVKSNA